MTCSRTWLSEDAWIDLYEGWMPSKASRSLADQLRRTVQWEARSIVLFGKKVMQPRLIAWCGDPPYRYSGQTLEPKPMPRLLRPVLARVRLATGSDFNHILLNRYRTGRDSMGLHADDEPELGPSPVVATLSLGTDRRFVVRDIAKQRVWDEAISSGSLLVMGGACQQRVKHEVPKQASVQGERISLTFRNVAFVARAGEPSH